MSMGMQSPLPTAPLSVTPSSQPDPQGGQKPSRPPDPGQPYRGWYPRWWLLSALLCAVVIGLLRVLQPVICAGRLAQSQLCGINTWTDWRQGLIVAAIWLMFLLGWLAAYVFGVGIIEISQKHRRTPAVRVIRALSEFRALHVLLLIYGIVALCVIIVTWFLNVFQPVGYALSCIVVFVGNSSFLYRREPGERRLLLVAYGVLAVVAMAVMLGSGLFQPIIFSTEVIIFLAGIWFLFRRPQASSAATPLTAEERLAQANAGASRPGNIFRDLLRSWFRNNPNAGNANQQAGNTNQGSPGTI